MISEYEKLNASSILLLASTGLATPVIGNLSLFHYIFVVKTVVFFCIPSTTRPLILRVEEKGS